MKLPLTGRDQIAFGIDLGTTNSTLCRAILPSGREVPDEPTVIEIKQPTPAGDFIGTILPSLVAFHQGREYVGQGAKDLRTLMADKDKGIVPNVTIFAECKNVIGTSRTYPNAPEGFRSPTAIASRILGYLRREGIQEPSANNVVVTVPASFQAAQRRETVRACELAGLDVSGGRLLDEPVAAFIDYAYRYSPSFLNELTGRKKLLVFDFGGGTCDIALFELFRTSPKHPVQVASRAVSRFHRLGGGDIDLAILHQVLIPQLIKENGLGEYEISFQDKIKIITPALIAVAEALKIQLCNELWRREQFGRLADTPRMEIVAKYPAQTSMQVSGKKLSLVGATLDANQFDKVIAPFLDTDHLFARSTEYRLELSIFAPISDAMERAGWERSEIDYVLPVGGSALIPQVSKALGEYFPNSMQLVYEDRKDVQLSVARGASLHALSLAASGRGIIEPVVQDDIYLATQRGDLKLVSKGTALPFPSSGVFANESLSVPEDAIDKPLRLSLELVAGDERRSLFRDHWEIFYVKKGDPLRLEFSYDENQEIKLELKQAKFPESAPFMANIENPLSHVINPNKTQEEIDRLEEAHRRNPDQADELIPKIAELSSELGQHDKAIGLMRALLRKANRPVAWLLNRQGMYEEARGNLPAAIRDYEEAGRATQTWGGPLFNLALLHDRQRRDQEALAAIDRAISVQVSPPYQTLQLRIRKRMHPDKDIDSQARELLHKFEDLMNLDDWALGWYMTAADLAADKNAREAAVQEQKRRRHSGCDVDDGVQPDMRIGE